MHIDKLKEAFSIQSKIEGIDKEIQVLDATVQRIQKFEKDAIIHMSISVNDPDNVPEGLNTKMIIDGPDSMEKLKSTLSKLNDYYNDQTFLNYDLTESDLLVVFASLLKIKKEAKEVLINQLKELGVTYELSKSKPERLKKTREKS